MCDHYQSMAIIMSKEFAMGFTVGWCPLLNVHHQRFAETLINFFIYFGDKSLLILNSIAERSIEENSPCFDRKQNCVNSNLLKVVFFFPLKFCCVLFLFCFQKFIWNLKCWRWLPFTMANFFLIIYLNGLYSFRWSITLHTQCGRLINSFIYAQNEAKENINS